MNRGINSHSNKSTALCLSDTCEAIEAKPTASASTLNEQLDDSWLRSSVYLPRLSQEMNPNHDNPVSTLLHRAAFAISRRAGRAFTFLAIRNMLPSTPIPPPKQEEIKLVPYADVDKRIGLHNVLVADRIPEQERCKLEPAVFGFQRFLSKLAPANPKGIPEIDPILDVNVKRTLPDYYFTLPWVSRPEIPEEIASRPNDVLAAVSLAGPFAAYIERVPCSNRYQIDLSKMCKYPVRNGLSPLGFIAQFHYNEVAGQMVTDQIDLPAENKRVVNSKDNPSEWQRAQRIALASLSTHMTAVRHLGWAHLAAGENIAAITSTHLSADHPVHTILHPHTFRTTATNKYRIPSLIGHETSALPSVFAYDRQRILELLDDTGADFDLRRLDPRADAELRKMSEPPIEYPYLKNVGAIWDLMQSHVREYVDLFYQNDEQVRDCPQLQNWHQALSQVRGAHDYTGPLSKDALVRLITVVMYTASIEHENVGNLVMNYTTLPQIPINVRLNGNLPSEAEYQAYVNLLMLTSTPFDPLLGGKYPGMHKDGQAIMTKMCGALQRLDDQLQEVQPVPKHAILPSKCAVSAAT